MKQLIFLILILLNYAFAYEFKLNEKDISYINNSKKKSFILNRIDKYQTLKTKVKLNTISDKINEISGIVTRSS